MYRYILLPFIVSISLLVSAQEDFYRLVDKGYAELEDGLLVAARNDLEKAIEMIPKDSDPEETAILHNNLGVTYYQLGLYKKGIDHYNLSLNYYKRAKNDTLIAESLLNLGLALKEIGAYDQAMNALIRSAQIFEKQAIQKELSACWNAMGNIQRELQDFDRALEYHRKALTIRQKIAYEKGIADSYHNIGSVYLDMHNPEKAEEYLLIALKRKKALGNQWNQLTTLTLLGQLYLEKDKPQKAFSYFNTAYDVRSSTGSSAKMASSLYYLGNYYFKIGDYAKARESFSQAGILAEESQDYQLLADVLSGEIRLLGKTHDKELLVQKYKELIVVKERMVTTANRKEIARLEISYDVDRKEREIKLAKKQAKIREVELENQRLRNWYLVFWLLVVLLITLLVVIALYMLRKRKQRIELQNIKLEQQKQEITDLHNELSHRTKNYFGMLSGILKSDKSKVQHPEAVKVLEENIRRLDAMSLVQHYLLTNVAGQNKEVRLDAYLNNLIDLLMINLSNPSVEVSASIEKVYLDYDVSMRLAIVLNELICNAIEHGLEGIDRPRLSIKISKKKKMIEMTVRDNGSGINGSVNVANSKGISLIVKLLQKINGSIVFKNEGGCVAEVVVPLK